MRVVSVAGGKTQDLTPRPLTMRSPRYARVAVGETQEIVVCPLFSFQDWLAITSRAC